VPFQKKIPLLPLF